MPNVTKLRLVQTIRVNIPRVLGKLDVISPWGLTLWRRGPNYEARTIEYCCLAIECCVVLLVTASYHGADRTTALARVYGTGFINVSQELSLSMDTPADVELEPGLREFKHRFRVRDCFAGAARRGAARRIPCLIFRSHRVFWLAAISGSAAANSRGMNASCSYAPTQR